MSELRVNKITPRSGTDVTLGDSGDTITIPSGVILANSGTFTNFQSTGIDDNATSTAITIDSSEQVGIGTISPSSPLEVDGTITIGTGTGTYQAGALGYSDSNWGFLYRPPRASSIGAHHFEAFNGDDIMTLTEGGNVGIGTASPSQALDVVGSIEVSDGIYVGGTAAANKLDDYEEGTFTPGIRGSTTDGTFTPTSAYTRGRYTKIGRLVHIYFGLVYSSFTGTGNIILTGLPFTSENTYMENTGTFVNTANMVKPSDTVVYARIFGNSSEVSLLTTSTTSTSRAGLAVDSQAEIYFSLIYNTD